MDRRPRRGPAAASRSASPSPQHGSDATHMETTAVRDGDEWVINGEKTWNTGIHTAQLRPDLRPHQRQGRRRHAASPRSSSRPTAPGFEIVEFLWTFNMPTDHAHIRLTDVRVPRRRRSSAARAAACRSCSTSSTRTASARPHRVSAPRSSASTRPSSTPRSASRSASRCRRNQAIQFPLVELQTQCEMLRALIHKTAWAMDTYGAFSVVRQGLDVQLLGQPAVLRGRRPRHAGARRPRLLAPQAVRAHLPPPPPLPHHRGRRGDPDAPRRRLHVRLHEAAGARRASTI